MKKNIWIMNHHANGMYFDKGGRHYCFAKYLKRAGYEPVVFCANSKHGSPETWFPAGALWQEHMAEEIGVPFVFVEARTYTGNGKQRILNMIDFYRNVKKTAAEYAAKHGKPDIIYASSVHPLTLVAGIQLARRFGVECVCEVRDMWPESLVAYGLLKQGTLLTKLLYAGEKWIYKKADRLIFTMEGAYDYIAEQGWEKAVPRSKVYCINNGVDLEVFDYNREHYIIEDPDLDNPDIFKVVYVGTIRQVNGLDALLDTAKEIAGSKVKFLIWGSGDQLDALRQRVQDEKIENVVFKGRVEKTFIPAIVSRADVNLIHGAGKEQLVRFGISANKMFDCFAAGKPVLMDIPAKYNPLVNWEAGIVIRRTDELPAAIQHIQALSGEERAALGEHARRAGEHYDLKNLTGKLLDVLKG